MIVKQKKFEALCINNQYKDFGNHTGFRFVDRIYDHLIVGEWYEFRKSKYVGFDLYIDGKNTLGTGHHFSIPKEGEYMPDLYDFYKFFSTVEAHRERKLDIMGI